MADVKRVFTVNGQPFFPVGGQSRNSSGYNDAESETAFKAVKLFDGNTLEIPVYWEQIEPEEGVRRPPPATGAKPGKEDRRRPPA